ncbi:hypothetical protein [Opitutus sp. ER46]|uniref:hypothetical protein n=1 Tax=Opitutus sp. ER46 TaxID=2161864 RepID=UPI000D2FD3D4|nr:hypothetical protein [Opitutus sp. ER46]PTX96567.1 hypothetical protein DB354_07880 [Opitutus sp. ER46]
MNARDIHDGPWCWQSKGARRIIRDAFDATNNVATALAVYDALTEIASDKQAESFETTHAWIQRLSGVGVSTIKRHLRVMADLGLVEINTPALRAPSTYRLLSIANHGPTIASSGLALANGTQIAPLATSEESEKNHMKNGGKEGAARPAPASVPFPWSSRFDLPPELAEKLATAFPNTNAAEATFCEIRGRKLMHRDSYPAADWPSVFHAEVDRAREKGNPGRSGRHFDNAEPHPGVTERTAAAMQSREGAAIPEPANWRPWVRENAVNPDLADQRWEQLDRVQQRYLADNVPASYAPKEAA